MNAAQFEQRLREAIVALAAADDELQILCERGSDLTIEAGIFATNSPLPALVFNIAEVDEENASARVEFIGCAQGNEAGSKARAICARVPELYTALALRNAGVDVLPGPPVQRSLGEQEHQGLQINLAQREGSPLWHAAVCVISFLWEPDTL